MTSQAAVCALCERLSVHGGFALCSPCLNWSRTEKAGRKRVLVLLGEHALLGLRVCGARDLLGLYSGIRGKAAELGLLDAQVEEAHDA